MLSETARASKNQQPGRVECSAIRSGEWVQMEGTLPHLDQMRRPYEVWYSSRHVFFRWTEDRFFQSAHSVGMYHGIEKGTI